MDYERTLIPYGTSELVDIVNRETLDVVRSVPADNYDPGDWLVGVDVSILDTIDPRLIKIESEQIVEVTAAEAAALDRAKRKKTRRIDKRTRELIGGGFEFKGQTVSLSECCQVTIGALYEMRENVIYPITICNKSDTGTLTIDSAGEAADLHAEMFSAVMAARGGGIALKSAVIASADVAAVDAVEDNR